MLRNGEMLARLQQITDPQLRNKENHKFQKHLKTKIGLRDVNTRYLRISKN